MGGEAAWGPGPWDDEPDRVEWRSEGLPCLAKRNHDGAWCGYVAVPPGHPAHGVDYDGVDVEVHGGLSYSAFCDGDENQGICHVPRPGEPADVWWLGFDCNHTFDLAPAMEARSRRRSWSLLCDATYRDLAYVRAEVESLARQLVALEASA